MTSVETVRGPVECSDLGTTLMHEHIVIAEPEALRNWGCAFGECYWDEELRVADAIAKLSASFTLRRSGRDGAKVSGVVRADVTQVCIVTLEPFAASVDEPVDVVFAPPAKAVPARRGVQEEVNLDLTAEDPPDTIVDGVVDLGALAAEFLALGLDPYPRKPGVEFAEPAPSETDSPFAALAGLKPEPGAKPKKKPKR